MSGESMAGNHYVYARDGKWIIGHPLTCRVRATNFTCGYQERVQELLTTTGVTLDVGAYRVEEDQAGTITLVLVE